MKSAIIAGIMLSVALVPRVASSQTPVPNVVGNWNLTTMMTLDGQEAACVFQGIVTLAQDGAAVTAPAALGLLSGPDACPGELLGDLSGAVAFGEGETILIVGTISGTDPGGAASFSGTIEPEAPGMSIAGFGGAPQAPPAGGGSMSVTQGPFAGLTGTWNAVPTAAVPTFAPLALVLLVGLLLAIGAYALRRQPHPSHS